MIRKLNDKGFTLIELMLVVILISILGGIVIPRYAMSTKKAKVQACEITRSIINKQVEQFFFVEATWPMDSLVDIGENVNYFPDGLPTCPVDLTSYTLAPSPSKRITGHKEGAGTHTFERMLAGNR